MKKTVFIVTMLLCFLFAAPLSAGEIFTDVNPDSWYYEEVNRAYETGLVAGTTDTTFSPNSSMTRGQFITILGRIEGVDSSDYLGFENNFNDLTFDYYIPYISWGYENGIVAGISETVFEPDKPITREQIASFLDRYINAMYYQLPSNPQTDRFRDAAKISSWAKNSMEAMRRYGIVAGDLYGNCNPQNSATRAEGAAMLMRFYDLISVATENESYGNGYCRLLCAATPSWLKSSENTTGTEHDKNLAALEPYFKPYIQSGETLAAVVQTKLNGSTLYLGITQKKMSQFSYKTANIIILDKNLKYSDSTKNMLLNTGSTYGINSVKPYYTPEGIFLFIVHSHGGEVTNFDLILVGTDNTTYCYFPSTLMQCKKESGQIKARFMEFVDYGKPLKKYDWQTIDFKKFPYVLGITK
ncbi:MAG: S-layer homology domain-containing protein [Firmicutes bacterium]|nr:S-layer homology domain-containing protein [Bacillota bacterium]